MRKRFDERIVLLIDKETKQLLMNVAHERGEDASGIIRKLVREYLARLSYLSEKSKKALGVSPLTTPPELLPLSLRQQEAKDSTLSTEAEP